MYPSQWPKGSLDCAQCKILLNEANHSNPSSLGWAEFSVIQKSAIEGCRCCQIVYTGVSTVCPKVGKAPEAVCFARKVSIDSLEWLRVGLKFSQDANRWGAMREWIDFGAGYVQCKDSPRMFHEDALPL